MLHRRRLGGCPGGGCALWQPQPDGVGAVATQRKLAGAKVGKDREKCWFEGQLWCKHAGFTWFFMALGGLKHQNVRRVWVDQFNDLVDGSKFYLVVKTEDLPAGPK